MTTFLSLKNKNFYGLALMQIRNRNIENLSKLVKENNQIE